MVAEGVKEDIQAPGPPRSPDHPGPSHCLMERDEHETAAASPCDITNYFEGLDQVQRQSEESVRAARLVDDAAPYSSACLGAPSFQGAVAQAYADIAAYQEQESTHLQRISALKDPLEVHVAAKSAASQAQTLTAKLDECIQSLTQALETQEIHFRGLLNRHQNSMDTILTVIRGQLATAAAAMAQIESDAEAALLTAQRRLLAAQASERDDLLSQRQQLAEGLMQQRIAVKEGHHRALEAMHASEHSACAALHLDFAQQISDLTCQMARVRGGNLLTRDKITYNCRVLGKALCVASIAESQQRINL